MNVLSLFDGISCGQLALKKAGIKVDKYFACEIDKHAIKVTQQNFPDTVQLGDVCQVFAKDLPQIDLIIGGSPCQGFSFAGKQLAFDDPRSVLFFEFVRLLKQCKPKYFLLENVKMTKQSENVISKYLDIAPIEINSNLVSAQNRKRLYWTNIGAKPDGLFGFQKCMIEQPKDRGILLADILQDDVPEKYFLSDKALAYLNKDSGNWSDRLSSVNYSNESKAKAIVANYCKGVPYNVLCIASRGRKETCLTPKRTDYGKSITKDYESGKVKEKRKNIQQLEPRTDGKTNCLTSVQKDNLVLIVPEDTKKGYAEIKEGQCFDAEQPNSKTRRGRKMANKSNCLLTQNQFMQFKQGKIRRLTPVECERLQTVPDGYTACVSDTQRYKALGNGWTVDIISHILKYIK